jgi:hypothetical protein
VLQPSVKLAPDELPPVAHDVDCGPPLAA